MIQVSPYNPDWPLQFKEQENLIRQTLGENCLEVHHIGSTSIPGLCAKPKIDILGVVKDSKLIIDKLEKVGYSFRGEINIPFHLYFTKKDEAPEVNLHMYEEGHPEITLNLLFRDYLRTHPLALQEYAHLKLDLVKQEALHEKMGGRFSGYTLSKDAFIKKTLTQAGFKELCIRFCTHHDEWQAARYFRQKHFFDKNGITDPYTWTFDHKEHVHFVLYLGTVIIGYAHIQLWPDDRAALRIIVIEEAYRNKGTGTYFLNKIESWLSQKGINRLHIQSSPQALNFYTKQEYAPMAFNDPEDHEESAEDIEIGKSLQKI
jgi:GrpB-like predicted nucleotidyltransferase (UPF0157 family)/GNAT superfamily N-acetyltransferase